jgi:hypothetical protein
MQYMERDLAPAQIASAKKTNDSRQPMPIGLTRTPSCDIALKQVLTNLQLGKYNPLLGWVTWVGLTGLLSATPLQTLVHY